MKDVVLTLKVGRVLEQDGTLAFCAAAKVGRTIRREESAPTRLGTQEVEQLEVMLAELVHEINAQVRGGAG